MTTLRDAAQAALEALESYQSMMFVETRCRFKGGETAIAALREALEQEEQEPVAFADRISFDQAMKSGKGHDVWPEAGDYEARTGRKLRVLYTHPPRREWQQPMARWKIDELMRDAGWQNSAIRQADLNKVEKVVRAVEAALKEGKA